jgi:Arc/MetJ-type ribon-helix-helix transcriptional regulator
MRTITLKLPDGLAARVSATVKRRGVSTSALVREALEDRLGSEKRVRVGSCLDLAGDLAGVLGGAADLSSNGRHLKGYGR